MNVNKNKCSHLSVITRLLEESNHLAGENRHCVVPGTADVQTMYPCKSKQKHI